MVKSLRWRLQIWHAIVLTAVLSIFGSVVYSLHWQTRLQQVDAELDRTAEVLLSRMRRLFPGPPFRGPYRTPPVPGRPIDSAGSPRPEFTRSFREVPRDGNKPGAPVEWSGHDAGRGDSRRGEPGRGERGSRSPRDRESGDRPPASLELPEEFQLLFEGQDESRFYYVIWGHEGDVLEKSMSAPEVPFPNLQLKENGLPVRSVRLRHHWREVTHVTRGDINVLVGRSIAGELHAAHRYGALLFFAGCGVLTAGFLGGGWLTSHAIRPILSMTATAQSISAKNLDQRIDLQDTATELGQLAVVLNGTFDRLQQAFDQQSRFTADASHELRTPLAVILAHTELALSRRRTPEEYQATLETCQRASTRMKSLIEGLLMLARFDSQQPVLETSEFELTQLIFECVELVQPLTEPHQIRIGTELEPVRIRGDRSRISQVVTNLLSNAIRYNRDGGSVIIGISNIKGGIRMRVSDSGVGIPAEELPHVFDRFYRVDKARSRADGGSGLGLSICKTIVEAHKGTIQVSSEPQKGTVVDVWLPNL